MYKKQIRNLLLGTVFAFQLLAIQGVAVGAEDWDGNLSLGYNSASGNTEKTALSVSGELKRIFDGAELLIKGDIYTSSSNKRMDDQKWTGLARTAFDIDDQGRWFSVVQFLMEHDRFADIDVRTTPSAGVGYWISNTDDWKWNVEAQLGYIATSYRSDKLDTSSAVFVGKTYLEKQIFEKGRISEGLTLTPSLDGGGFLIKSETEFTNPISDVLDFNIKYILDYNSEPATGKKKTDTRIITGIKYSF
ncbi:hypothetical protein MNBD_UNCLBAC01-1853 [hydrothermal vent metagenome]|uniref:DUF481 domain-containing protein n=1 Tax=hydrothermal vent metagenome TaxID=652676 RepID=A0A3B1DXE4_9ZZZZ